MNFSINIVNISISFIHNISISFIHAAYKIKIKYQIETMQTKISC